MNALKARARYDMEQREKAREESYKTEQEKLANMSDEEKEEYLYQQKVDRRKHAELLASIIPLDPTSNDPIQRFMREYL